MKNLTSKIPILNIPDKPLYDTVQNHIPVTDVYDDFVLLKDGGAAMILESTSLNFGLLSEREQEAVVAAYAALINSLSFPVQILVRTQTKDISKYIFALDAQIPKIVNPKLKTIMLGYKEFISETISKQNVLSKRFFLIIPFSPYEIGLSKSTFSAFSPQRGPLPYTKEYIIKKVEVALFPKRDHLIKQAARLGLKLTTLNKEEAVKLFYNIFNPDTESVQLKYDQESNEEDKKEEENEKPIFGQ